MSRRIRASLNEPTRGLPNWVSNSLVAVISTFVCLAGLELTIRVLGGRPTRTWTDRPSFFFMPANAPDMGDRAYSPAKPPDTFRISVIGDSFTFGPRMQVEDTFPKRLERWLNLNGQVPNIEVINRGVSGTATKSQVALVRKELEGIPDVILLQITLNDAEDHLLTPTEKEAQFGGRSTELPILRNFHLLKFIFSRLDNAESRRAYVRYHASAFEKSETYEPFKKAINMISQDCKSAGVKLFAVIFPMFDFPFDSRYPFQKTHEIIGNTLREAGVPALDLLPAYDGIPNEHLLVFPGVDNHPNEIANRLAAERILLYLKRNKLIPEGSFPIRTYRNRQNLKEKQIQIRGKKEGRPEDNDVS